MAMNPRAHRVDQALRLPALLLCALAAAAVAGNAHGELYKWTDDHGVIHYSDKLPVEAVNRANAQLSRQGITLHRTEQMHAVAQQAPKTESDAQKLREAERERVVAERRDKALIESYANESEIDLAKSRAIATIDGQLQSAHAFIAQISRRRKELEDKKATFAPRPVPGEIPREIETIDDEIGRQNDFIASKTRESSNVAARYDSDKARFRELKSAQSGAVITSSEARYSARQVEGIALTSAK
jgi:hypothetical protein